MECWRQRRFLNILCGHSLQINVEGRCMLKQRDAGLLGKVHKAGQIVGHKSWGKKYKM